MPAREVQHLTLQEVLVMHERLLKRFGGAAGVRDLGLLESALFRPRTGHYADVAQMATALFESLIMNHAFVDGNKRVAFFGTDVFLRLNGWCLVVAPRSAHAFLLRLLESHRCDYARLLPWIRRNLVRAD